MKLAFAKFVTIVALGTALSALGGATLSSAEVPVEEPVRLEVRILETAGPCECPTFEATLPL